MIDEKAAFYLRHRKEIEEWSALRSSAARLVDETLVSRFSGWSGDVDGTVRSTEDLLDGAWPRVYCARREWREQGLRLAVVLEWNRSRLLGSSRAPYLGARVLRQFCPSVPRASDMLDIDAWCPGCAERPCPAWACAREATRPRARPATSSSPAHDASWASEVRAAAGRCATAPVRADPQRGFAATRRGGRPGRRSGPEAFRRAESNRVRPAAGGAPRSTARTAPPTRPTPRASQGAR